MNLITPKNYPVKLRLDPEIPIAANPVGYNHQHAGKSTLNYGDEGMAGERTATRKIADEFILAGSETAACNDPNENV